MVDYGYGTAIKILVVGEEKVGKSCLISYIKDGFFTSDVAHVLPPLNIEADCTCIKIPLVFYDTSTRDWITERREAELRQADVIILCYACNDASTLDEVKLQWLPLFRSLKINAPIILTKCKTDSIDHAKSLEAEAKSIFEKNPEIDSCIECSALTGRNVFLLIRNAQKTAVYPCSTLFDRLKGCLKPSCERALKHIFMYFDKDKDGILNDIELNNFQVTCFNEALDNAEILHTKNFVQTKFPEGVYACGITFSGFIFLHISYIKEGVSNMTWTCLRKFGYDNRFQIRDDLLPTSLTWNSHQRVELAEEAMEFLRRTFSTFDVYHDGALQPSRVDDLFSTAPESCWNGGNYVDAAEKTLTGELTLNGFLSMWALMTVINPASTFANLKCIGYEGNHSSAFYVSKRRGLFQRWDYLRRNVFQCLVFGPRKAGKSTMLNLLIERPFIEEYIPTTHQHFAANIVNLPGQTEKILVMLEIPPDEVATQLINQEFLAGCDVAVFAYDSSDEYSWTQALDIFRKVSGHAELGGFNLPCLFVATKSDLQQKQFIQEDSSRVCHHMNLQPPRSINIISREKNIFQIILLAAQRPDQNIPNRKQRRIGFMFYSVSAIGAAVGGLVAVHLCSKKLKEKGDPR